MAGHDVVAFRCLRCGGICDVVIPHSKLGSYIALTLGMGRTHAVPIDEPTCPCGGTRWVRVGSTTEFYRWHVRADVCRIGNHVDPRTRAYELRPREPFTPAPGTVALTNLTVHACPDHVDVLRTDGMHGFFLVDLG